jgi:hypothetical protein
MNDRHTIARLANLRAQGSTRPCAPRLSGDSTTVEVLAWLAWDDLNGDFSGLSQSEAWELLAAVVEGF